MTQQQEQDRQVLNFAIEEQQNNMNIVKQLKNIRKSKIMDIKEDKHQKIFNER